MTGPIVRLPTEPRYVLCPVCRAVEFLPRRCYKGGLWREQRTCSTSCRNRLTAKVRGERPA